MPAGRPPLDPETRRQRRQDSRKLYNEKYRYFSPYGAMNTDLPAEMQTNGVQTHGCGCNGKSTNGLHPPPLTTARHRTNIAASDYSTRRKYCEHAAEASQRYRDQKASKERTERRNANALRKHARDIEREALRRNPPPSLAPPPPSITAPAPSRTSPSPSVPLGGEGSQGSIFALARRPRSQQCKHCFQEDCVGLCAEEDCSGCIYSDGEDIDKHLYFCLPVYEPDPGHEDKDAHSASKRGTFYGVVSETWGGVLTSKHSFELKLQAYPGARTFESSTWAGITDLWLKDCEHNHRHAERERAKAAKSRRTPSPTKAASKSKVGRAPSPTKATTGGKVGRVAPSPTKLPVNPFAAHHRPCQVEVGAADGEARVAHVASMFETLMGAKDTAAAAGLFYGVSGHTRIFQDRKRAWAVFKDTPGAEFFFSDVEDEVWVFVEEEAARMRARKGAA
ncbi:hypothetical protein B0H19DRAFT_1068299 [Mycena capillaripes]|nr:hypothetical protein B0H19DRAFT_1068299 [Mycena capillaripes]